MIVNEASHCMLVIISFLKLFLIFIHLQIEFMFPTPAHDPLKAEKVADSVGSPNFPLRFLILEYRRFPGCRFLGFFTHVSTLIQGSRHPTCISAAGGAATPDVMAA